MTEFYRVIANRLNLRARPQIRQNTRIATMPHGQRVEKLDESAVPGWWKIKTELNGVAVEGYAASQYLELDNRPLRPQPRPTAAPEVHLRENNPSVHRGRDDGGRASPLGEAPRPNKPQGNQTQKIAGIYDIVNWLDVETRVRYLPKSRTTYCNIYAYDFCYLSGHYLPRVWWTAEALAQFERGQEVEASYAQTVTELNANALHDWLLHQGPRFGWRRTLSLDECQHRSNQGEVGIICAQHADRSRSGHITIILPETGDHKAARANGRVIRPLQSQAGRDNSAISAGTRAWWQGNQFASFGYWMRA